MTSGSEPPRKGPPGSGGGDPERPAQSSTGGRPIDMDRVRHLLKSKRYEAGARREPPTRPAGEAGEAATTARGPSLFQRRATASGEAQSGQPDEGSANAAPPDSAPSQDDMPNSAPAASAPAPQPRPVASSKPAPASPPPQPPAGQDTTPTRPARGNGTYLTPARPRAPTATSDFEDDAAPASSESKPPAKRPRKPLPPLRSDVRSDSYWFAAQPEIQRLREDHGEAVTGWGEQEEEEVEVEETPGEVAGPVRSRTFREVDHESWFAHQPEVQRLISDREPPPQTYFADNFEPPPEPVEDHRPAEVYDHDPGPPPEMFEREFDREFERERERARPSHRAVEPPPFEMNGPDAAFAHAAASTTSGWFADQPEFQRMRAEADAPRRSGRSVFKPLLVLAVIGGVGAFVWYGEPEKLVDALDVDALVTQVRQLGSSEPAAQPDVVVEPTVLNAPSSEPEPAAAQRPAEQRPAARAPNAVSEPSATGGGPGVTVLIRRAVASPAPSSGEASQETPEPATPAAFGAPAPVPPPIVPDAPTGQPGAGGSNQSIFVPTARTPPEPPAPPSGAANGADPFSTFSIDGGAQQPTPPAAPGNVSGEAPAGGLDIPALAAVERGAAIQADEIDAHIAEARTLFVGRDFDGAARLLRDVLAADSSNVAALKLYGDILMRRRELDAALEVFDAIIAAEPSDARTHINRGTVLLALDRESAAIAAANSALDIAPNTLAAVELRSKANAAAGNMPEAMAGCEEVNGLSNSKAAVEWCRAAAQNQSGNHFVAVRMFIAALNTGEQGFVRAKQVQVRDLGLYDGPVDGLSSQPLIDAVTSCAVARDCIL